MVIIPGFLRELVADYLARETDDDPDALMLTSVEGRPRRNSNLRRQVWHHAFVEVSAIAT